MIVWRENYVSHALILISEVFDQILSAEVFQTFLKIVKSNAKIGIILKKKGQILRS